MAAKTQSDQSLSGDMQAGCSPRETTNRDSEPAAATRPAHAASVTRIATENASKLHQLWLELGIPRDDQVREEDALLRDVKSLYERKVQFYQDERELSSKRITVLQREIAHIRWLFRDDDLHEFGDEEACSIRDKLASLEVKFKCLNQIRETRAEKLVVLETELAQLLMRVGEDDCFERQQIDDDAEENLSKMKILSIQSRIDRLRPLVEELASKIAEDAASCSEIMVQLGMKGFSDFDHALLHYGENLKTTLQTATKVSMRLHQLQIAFEEAKALWKLIDKREGIILERCEYDRSINDSMRLTSRTGDAGRLLREERLRKKISKDLPKVTLYLEKHLVAWEERHAMQFIWEGRAYLSHMRAVDSDYEAKAEKEREKKSKHQLLRSASVASRDESKQPSRLRRRNSVASESVPAAPDQPPTADATRRRRFSAHCDGLKSLCGLTLASK